MGNHQVHGQPRDGDSGASGNVTRDGDGAVRRLRLALKTACWTKELRGVKNAGAAHGEGACG